MKIGLTLHFPHRTVRGHSHLLRPLNFSLFDSISYVESIRIKVSRRVCCIGRRDRLHYRDRSPLTVRCTTTQQPSQTPRPRRTWELKYVWSSIKCDPAAHRSRGRSSMVGYSRVLRLLFTPCTATHTELQGRSFITCYRTHIVASRRATVYQCACEVGEHGALQCEFLHFLLIGGLFTHSQCAHPRLGHISKSYD